MRSCLIIVSWALVLAGCAEHAPPVAGSAALSPLAPSPQSPPVASTKSTYVPIMAVSGKIVMSNPKARFVILNLAPGVFPPKGTRLFVYRNGEKVADLKISGPQWDDKIVADILNGDPQVNDQINDN